MNKTLEEWYEFLNGEFCLVEDIVDARALLRKSIQEIYDQGYTKGFAEGFAEGQSKQSI